ncbi:MAG: DNA-formamidopyrimidine glycosylase family protein, partial [Psychrobacter sp.]
MPELPEVETTKASLDPLLGQQVVDVKVFQPKLRWMMPDNLDYLINHTLDRVERRAKYLILNFLPAVAQNNSTVSADLVEPRQLLVHLGMSGSLQQHSDDTDKRK